MHICNRWKGKISLTAIYPSGNIKKKKKINVIICKSKLYVHSIIPCVSLSRTLTQIHTDRQIDRQTHPHTDLQRGTPNDGAFCIWRRPNSLGWLSEKRLWPQIMKYIIGPAFTVKRENIQYVWVCPCVCLSVCYGDYFAWKQYWDVSKCNFMPWCKITLLYLSRSILDNHFQVSRRLEMGWDSDKYAQFHTKVVNI